MRRLAIRDRKRITGAAMVSAELWNIARDREKHPEPFDASDFLPELPEERIRREREYRRAHALAGQPPTKEELAQLAMYKERLFKNLKKTIG